MLADTQRCDYDERGPRHRLSRGAGRKAKTVSFRECERDDWRDKEVIIQIFERNPVDRSMEIGETKPGDAGAQFLFITGERPGKRIANNTPERSKHHCAGWH